MLATHAPCKETFSIHQACCLQSLLRFGQVYCLQACFDWTSLLPACLLRLDKFRWDKVTISMHPSNSLAPRASCILCFIQVSFDPRSIFIQDVTKFLLPLKKRPSIQKPGTSLMLKGHKAMTPFMFVSIHMLRLGNVLPSSMSFRFDSMFPSIQASTGH